VVGASVAALAAGAFAAVPTHAADAITTNGCINSVPEPDTTDPVQICYSLFQPASASVDNPVPVIFHSHGWGGSRTTTASSFASWTNAGFGVISFDQRGFGESGGKAHVENPAFEGQDVTSLVDLVASLDWVAKDSPETPDDPVIGAIGGSYGGGYQFVGAFTDLMERGSTRFDALAPEITWWDLKESLAPSEVVRSLWVSALYAVGADANTMTVNEGFAYGAATGQWPKGEIPGVDLDAFFLQNGPAWHASQGRLLDVPVLFGQGETDNLFNLNQGLKNFAGALTPEARGRSILIGYNGGHVLPAALPTGTNNGSSDPCSAELNGGSGSFSAVAQRFMREELKGESTGLGGRGLYHLATADGRCQTVSSVAATTDYPAGTVVTNVGPGVPQHVKLADGPLTVAGLPTVSASVTSAAVEGRAFFALAVGTSAADAKIVQSNMLPLRSPLPVTGEARSWELPAVAIDVPAGSSLFLTVSPFSDMSFGHGSRVPGAMLLEDIVVHVPVVA
jgi:pimeloyl-ACP methyl ester carboxylesterase